MWEQAIRKSLAQGAAEDRDALLNIPETAAEARRARDLLNLWEIPRHPHAFDASADAEAFAGWMADLESKLGQEGWITFSDLPRALRGVPQVAAAGAREADAGSLAPIELAGFDEVAPADRRLFDAWGAREQIEEPAPGRAVRVRLASRMDELEHAAGWARRRLELDPAARIGVVVRGLAELSGAAERIFDDALHPGCGFAARTSRRAFHVSAGTASSETPSIDSALLAIGLGSGLPPAEAGRLLRSPFVKLSDDKRIALDRDLRRQGVEQASFDLPLIRNAFPEAAAERSGFPGRLRPSQWSAAFSRLLKASGWPGARTLSSAEYQTAEHWNGLLSSLAELDLVLPALGYAEALARLGRIASGSRFASSDRREEAPEAPIQIMDMLEAAGSRFDALWIAGLHAGVWPQPPRPHPFLPIELQRSARLPQSSAERELAYARRMMARLLGSAPEVVCSYPARENEEDLQPSPLLAALPAAVDLPGVNLPGGAETAAMRVFAAGATLEEHTDDRGVPVEPGTPQPGGMSVLANQSACPFRAFAMHRLRAREMDESPLGVSPRERGNVAHEALKNLWGRLGSQDALKACSPERLADLIHASVGAALDHVLGRRDASGATDRFRQLEQTRLEKLLDQWLKEENKRPRFTVIQSETEEETTISGLRLAIRADRIDRYDGGGLAILDYKTAKILNKSDWEGDRPDAPQLPLYAVARGDGVVEIAYAKLVPGELKLIAEPRVEARAGEWRVVLEKLAADFREGRAAVDPKDRNKTCRLCPLPSLCRIGDVAGGAGDDEGDDAAEDGAGDQDE